MAMLSSQDNSAYIQNQEQDSSPLNSEFDWNSQENRAEIFRLIEVYLCFEACLYHQILPLIVEDETLVLGMVNPEDGTALEYASRILAYVNRTVSIYVITAEQHRELLSAYLNFKNSTQVQSTSPETSAQTELESEESAPTTPHTLIAEYEFPQQVPEPPLTTINTNTHSPINSQGIPLQELANLEGTINPKKIEDLPILCIPHPDDLNPLGLLPTLPPKQFLAELIARVINRGIGRLYFERLPYKGRILWSENGVLQSVLEKLPLSVFQGGLNELKRFAKLPLQTISEAKQVEREYLYQQQRLMVRIRVMPGMYGEEATLQVLRGAALKFY